MTTRWIRCAACDKKLFELKSGDAVISIKCGRCAGISVIDTAKLATLA